MESELQHFVAEIHTMMDFDLTLANIHSDISSFYFIFYLVS